jgi:DedD protein
VDRHLKERLVGAVVLAATAVILIPEMLSGPREPDATKAAGDASTESSKLKTYSIDLSKQTTTPASPPTPTIAEMPVEAGDSTERKDTVVSTAAPPAEESPPATPPARQPTLEPASSPPSATIAESRPPSPQKQADQEAPQAESRNITGAATEGWTVQVGSFGVRATSDRLAAELKKAGFPAFVVAFQSGAQTMYRVRLGPVRDRAAAEVLLRKVKPQHPNATLVAPQ